MSGRGPIDSDDVPRGEVDATLLLYDWFKHMTTLSLVTLGGVLGILQGATTDVRPGFLGIIVSAIAIAGILGFDGQGRIIRAVHDKRPLPSWLDWNRRLAMASYGVGVGGFLSLIVESVG